MKNLKTHLVLIAILLSTGLFAQSSANQPAEIKFNLFQPEDSLGFIVLKTLDKFERFGHFGAMENGRKDARFIQNYMNLFEPGAMMPDDLTDTVIQEALVSKANYEQLAKNHGFFTYVLFIEKQDTTRAVKRDNLPDYYTTLRFFKLFKDKAIMGDTCQHGAIYEVDLRIQADTALVTIENIRLAKNGDHRFFYLGNYGRHIYSPILIASRLESLVVPIPPPYKPTSQPTKSNLFIHAGYVQTSFLQPEALRNNLNTNYAFSGSEWGRSIGLKYQKAFSPKDIFGIFAGLEYEENFYDFKHTDASFVYTEDEFGDALIDLEGSLYDRKYTEMASYDEKGTLTYLKPEVGLFFNLVGKRLNLQLIGSVGNAFLMTHTYEANAMVSYEGEIEDLGVRINQEELGFYSDLEKSFQGNLTEAQSYMFYKAGAGLDILLGQRIGISFLFEYRRSFTYALRKESTQLMFLDPDTGSGFESQFNTLSDSRLYNALSLQMGIKIYLNELR